MAGFGLNGNAVELVRTSEKPVSMPVLPIWLEIQTYAGLPVNTPVPPRTCVLRLPNTSQLKPTRGDQSGVALGSAPVLYLIGLPPASRNVRASTAGLSNAVLPNLAMSTRKPPVIVRFDLGLH